MTDAILNLVSFALGGIILASGIKWLLQKFDLLKDTDSKYNNVAAAIIGTVLGILIQTVLLLNVTVPRIEQEVKGLRSIKELEIRYPPSFNPYVEAQLWLSNLEDLDQRELFTLGFNRIAEKINQIPVDGLLRIEREDIFYIWDAGFARSDSIVMATNLVATEDWSFFSRDGAGANVQSQAIDRDVRIERILLFDPKDPAQMLSQIRLAEQHDSLGVNILWGDLDWIEKRPFYNRMIQRLGTIDIVIYDRSIVLLTHVNPRDKKMEYSELSANPELVRIALEMYESIRINALPCLPDTLHN